MTQTTECPKKPGRFSARAIRHVYAAGNRLTSVTDAASTTLFTLDYDIRGNQTLRTRGALEDQFTFDKANRLTDTAIGASSATHTGGTLSSYLYDGLGRRVRETTGQITVSGYSQAGQLLYQDDRKPAIDEKHVYIYLAGSLVAKRTVPVSGSTVITYQHSDALGSPIATTNASGALIAYERLTAYGEPADTTMQRGPGFTGHVMDPTTSLVYMQQRYYDPVVGRFISIDPLASNASTGANFNRYLYANGNPVKFSDPDGRETVMVINLDMPHAGLWTSRGAYGGPSLYDPNGDYPDVHGSTETAVDEFANLDAYVRHQMTDGGNVVLFRFSTTAEEEQAIYEYGAEHGSSRLLDCAVRTTNALRNGGGDRFDDLETARTPSGAAESARAFRDSQDSERRQGNTDAVRVQEITPETQDETVRHDYRSIDLRRRASE